MLNMWLTVVFFTHILNILKTDVDFVCEIADPGSHFDGYNLIA